MLDGRGGQEDEKDEDSMHVRATVKVC